MKNTNAVNMHEVHRLRTSLEVKSKSEFKKGRQQ